MHILRYSSLPNHRTISQTVESKHDILFIVKTLYDFIMMSYTKTNVREKYHKKHVSYQIKFYLRYQKIWRRAYH